MIVIFIDMLGANTLNNQINLSDLAKKKFAKLRNNFEESLREESVVKK